MKPIFTASDFEPANLVQREMFVNDFKIVCYSPEKAAELANAKLERLMSEWPVVYSFGTQQSWVRCKTNDDTHQARLAFIEEIPKEKCEHDKIESFELTTDKQLFLICKACQKKLKPTGWEVVT